MTGTWRTATPAPIGVAGNFRYADPWTGRSLAILIGDGSIALFNPTTDTWHHSPPPAPALQLAGTNTPLAALNGSIVIANGGALTEKQCCLAIEGTYSYAIPTGF